MSATLNMMPPQRPLSSRWAAAHPCEAALASVLLHALALGGLLLLAVKPPPPPPVPHGDFTVMFAPAPAAPSPSVMAQAQIAAAVPVARPVDAPPLGYTPRLRPSAPRRTPPAAPAVSVRQEPPAGLAATAPAAANPVPAPAPDNGAALAALEARIGAAVNAAKFYPPAARLMHRQGRVAVSFAYRDGSVEQVALAQPSQVASLDNAALAAVRRARYPMPPPSLGGQSLHLRVWVDFALVEAD